MQSDAIQHVKLTASFCWPITKEIVPKIAVKTLIYASTETDFQK